MISPVSGKQSGFPVAEFSSRMQSTQAGGFSLLQVGNRMAVAYSTPTQGLMLQFSEPNCHS